MTYRVGTGFDVHKFTRGRDLILGGVNIPYERGLLGYSDADALIHAVMDSLLGGAALPDIGVYFPDSDPEWKGASSLAMLRRVAGILKEAGYSVCNVDATIICQEPRIAPYRMDMIENISGALGLEVSCVNVKATTTEGLGFPGQKEGVAAQAVCMLKKDK